MAEAALRFSLLIIEIHRVNIFIPSLGSATANETFFSSLIESSKPAKRGVTFPSTSAAVCSSAGIISGILVIL